MDYSEMHAYFLSHPPRCLEPFQVLPVTLEGAVFDGHGEELNPVFQIKCRCGNGTNSIKGHFWLNPEHADQGALLLSPIELVCGQCGEACLLFDTDLHGYDVELGYGSATLRGEGSPGSFRCANCGSEEMDVFTRFEYSDDLFDDGFEEARGREQDLFSWFSLHGRCAQCGWQHDITDFECA